MKYAVYVEGQSEMLFVVDVLQKYSNYDPNRCGFFCINLESDDWARMNHPKQGDENSMDYYMIVNVNNDNRVISKLNNDIQRLLRNGFNVIIGLKDVFGEAYKDLAGQSVVDRAIIERMYQIQKSSINVHEGDLRLHFAIMEYESWMFALIEKFVVSKGADLERIFQDLGINKDCDPETEIFHPCTTVNRIYQACGENYDKHEKDSYSFLSTLSNADYESLRHSGRCASFAKFIDSLLGAPCPELP